MKKKISILIPLFNEKESIKNIYIKVYDVIKNILEKYDYEIIFLDNNSNDGSHEICKQISENNNNVKIIKLSRNFGYQSNILAGYENCAGDCAITIHCDGQDDPKYILDFINMWENGYDVVYGIMKTRKDNFFLKIIINIFYKLLNYSSDISIPRNAGDFRLVNRRVINHVKNFKEKNIFLRGVLFYVGFNQIGLEYDRKERVAGHSKFSLMQYFDFGQNGILAFTKFPLKFIAVFGCTVLMINIILILYYLYLYFAGAITQPGFTTLVLVFLLSFSMIIFFLGIISLYVGQIIDEVKNRPRYIIDEKSKF